MKKNMMVALLLLVACSSKYSGFLSDYDSLEPHKENPGALYWQTDDIDLSGYDTLMIDPVQVYLAPGTQESELDPAKLRQFANMFHDALVKELKDYYSFTDKAGPHTLRLRFAISNIRSLPLTDEKDKSPRADATAALLEGEALDSASGEVLAMAVDKLADEELDQMATPDKRLQYAKALCEQWAKK